MKKSVKNCVAEARSRIDTCEVEEAMAMLERDDVIFVDVRDEPELRDGGKLPGAVHASRGMLEYYIDPESPYHKNIFSKDLRFVFYCKSGGRSALAAHRAAEMGLARVVSMNGGFSEWIERGGLVENL